jgi:glycosyltransferase involved in cell wall biosynthesis
MMDVFSEQEYDVSEINFRVSAIVPLYNGAHFIAETLNSIFCQSLAPWEVIVVDDGSSDDGPDIVRRISRAQPITLLRKPNGGQSSARNFGVSCSSGTHIAFLDQDDIWYPHHLSVLARPFLSLRDTSLGWTYGNLDEIDKDGKMVTHSILRTFPARHPKSDLVACLSGDMYVLPSASLIAKHAFDAVGGFDETLSGYEDDDLFLRLLREGYDDVFINKPVTKWRIHSNSASFSYRMALSRMIYFRKLLVAFPDDPARGKLYSREYLVPRFFPVVASDYVKAIRARDVEQARLAAKSLKFLSCFAGPRARAVFAVALPLLGFQSLMRKVLPILSPTYPMVHRLVAGKRLTR